MNNPDTHHRDGPLPLLKRLDGDPVFDEPWQARIMALVAELTRENAPIPPTIWVSSLGHSLRQDTAESGSDEAQIYYEKVLQLFESLLNEKGVLTHTEITQRIACWKTAYRNTPHGKPVLLSAADKT